MHDAFYLQHHTQLVPLFIFINTLIGNLFIQILKGKIIIIDRLISQ